MPIEVSKQELVERTAEQVRTTHPHLFMKAKRGPVGPIPAEQKVVVMALAVAPGMVVGDQDALETAVEGLTGVQVCKVCNYGQAPTADKVPEGKELVLMVEAGFSFRDIPE